MIRLLRVNKQCTCPLCGKLCNQKIGCKHLHGIIKVRDMVIPPSFIGDKNAKYRYLNEFHFKREAEVWK